MPGDFIRPLDNPFADLLPTDRQTRSTRYPAYYINLYGTFANQRPRSMTKISSAEISLQVSLNQQLLFCLGVVGTAKFKKAPVPDMRVWELFFTISCQIIIIIVVYI